MKHQSKKQQFFDHPQEWAGPGKAIGQRERVVDPGEGGRRGG